MTEEQQKKELEIALTSYIALKHTQEECVGFIDGFKEALSLFAVSGQSEQFVCLCPRNETDNCDRKQPCKECETCPHLRQTNCH